MKTSLVLFVVIVLVVLQSSYAQIPRTLSYQAVLTDNAGVPKPDGSYLILSGRAISGREMRASSSFSPPTTAQTELKSIPA